MITFNTLVRLFLGLLFMFLGIRAMWKRELSGTANSLPFTKGIYNKGKPYYKFTGKPAVLLGLLLLLTGLYLFFLIYIDGL